MGRRPRKKTWAKNTRGGRIWRSSVRPTGVSICANPLSCEGLVYWDGTDAQIWMHALCAQRLVLHLAKDGLNAADTLPDKPVL